MKKIKLLITFLILVCVISMLSACGHKHEFSTEWEKDANNHWHTCLGDGCSEKADEAAHNYGEGKVTTPATEEAEGVMTYSCKTCGYEKTEAIAKLEHVHTWETEWSMDGTHHWHASTCGHEDKDKAPHIFDDGYVEKPATETEEGLMVYTCFDCGCYYEEVIETTTHVHKYSEEWTTDENYHWHAATCGHDLKKSNGEHDFDKGTTTKEPTEEEEGITSYFCKTCNYEKQEPIDKLPHVHVFDEETLKCKCGLVHTTCDICGNCSTDGCVDHKVQCAFIDPDKTIYYAPSISLAAPEGPDGKEPGTEGAYIYDTSIIASHTVLDNGARAVLVSLPNGTKAHSGISFANNRDAHSHGQAGYNCGIPAIGGYYKHIRLYFTNHGTTDISFKYSAINYYYDYGAVELTLKPGESAVVLMKSLLTNDSGGVNHQIVFTSDVAAGSSLSVWGEYSADENLSGISVSVPASKLNFGVGETFSAEGLILKASGRNYGSVYIIGNYKTDLDGYVFTAEDALAGKKTVTVSFAGFTATYDVVIYDHAHKIEYVAATAPVKCTTDGVAAHYKCTVDGCGMYFADAIGNKVISAPATVSCHTEPDGTILPGTEILCVDCGKPLGAKSMTNWMLYTPSAKVGATIGSTIGTVKLEYGTVNGMPGTFVTFAKGAVGSATNSSGFSFNSENNLDVDNGVPYQHKIPNVGTNMADGSTRKLIMYFENHGDEDITLTFVNDTHSSVSITVTVPAHGTAIGETTMAKAAGYNWFKLYLKNTEALKSDVKIGMYGYVEILEGETDAPTVKQEATTKTFKVGETFSAEGLILNVFLPNTYGRDMFVWTGYTTSLDGKVFTADDVGTHIVMVTFAGKTCTYEITVTAE